jgi:hypothetical protein
MKNNVLIQLALVGSLAVGLQAEFLRDDSKNIVLDSSNGLIWQDDTEVKTTKMTWAVALTYCEGLSAGGYDDWRLPNQNELRSIIDKSRVSPSLSPKFVNFASNYFWSSTTYAGSTDGAWGVDFDDGYDYAYYKTSSFYVRCVRAGQ